MATRRQLGGISRKFFQHPCYRRRHPDNEQKNRVAQFAPKNGQKPKPSGWPAYMSLAGRLADTGDKTIMLYAIVLICGLSTPHLNCDETTAHRYERVPGGNELPFMCQRSAEIWAAEHVEIKAGEYPKIRCSRHEFGSRVG